MTPTAWLRAAAVAAALAAAPALAQYPPPAPYPPQPVYPAQPVYPPPQAYPPPQGYPPPTGYPSAGPPRPENPLQLSAYTGWQMNGDISAYAGTLVLDDAMNYGVSLDYKLTPGSGVQLLWIYNDTTAHFSSRDLFYPSTKDFGLQQHYFQVGGTQGFRRGKIETFGGASLGAALFMPGTVTKVTGGTYAAHDTWTFAMTLGGGAKIFFSERVALRLEGRMMLPMLFSGGSFYVGTGGSGMAVSAGIPSIQGAFTAGLTVAL